MCYNAKKEVLYLRTWTKMARCGDKIVTRILRKGAQLPKLKSAPQCEQEKGWHRCATALFICLSHTKLDSIYTQNAAIRVFVIHINAPYPYKDEMASG